MFSVDDPEWRKWMNQHFYVRQGVSFQEMTGSQRDAAFGLLEASLSARGLKLTRDIMRLNETLAELTNDHSGFPRKRASPPCASPSASVLVLLWVIELEQSNHREQAQPYKWMAATSALTFMTFS